MAEFGRIWQVTRPSAVIARAYYDYPSNVIKKLKVKLALEYTKTIG